MHLCENKSEVSPTVVQSKFNELLSQYDGYTHIFIDESKIGEAVGSAAIMASQVRKKCLLNNSSIFSAVAHGILLALDRVHQFTGSQLLLLYYSLSCLQSLQNRSLSHALISEIVRIENGLLSGGISVFFMWLPSHVGLTGNLAVGIATKAALLLLSNITVSHLD